MLPSSATIAKSRLIDILKLDRLEVELTDRERLVTPNQKEMTPSEFRSFLMKRTTAKIEGVYKHIFTCVPNKYTKESLIDDLVEEYIKRLNNK